MGKAERERQHTPSVDSGFSECGQRQPLVKRWGWARQNPGDAVSTALVAPKLSEDHHLGNNAIFLASSQHREQLREGL